MKSVGSIGLKHKNSPAILIIPKIRISLSSGSKKYLEVLGNKFHVSFKLSSPSKIWRPNGFLDKNL